MRNSTLKNIEITESIRKADSLAGDDLSSDQIIKWYKEEELAFDASEVSIYSKNLEIDPFYIYLRSLILKLSDCLRWPEKNKKIKVLCIGPGDGSEIKNIKGLLNNNLYFIESSNYFIDLLEINFPGSNILKSEPLGEINLKDASIDIVICLSVLHHMPNVTKIISECYRVLDKDGTLIIREPCSSMGNWKNPERKSTPNERGIPRKWLLKTSKKIGFQKLKSTPIAFLPLSKLFKLLRLNKFMQSNLYFILDRLISLLLVNNDKYFRKSFFQKLGPNVYFYELRK